MCGLVSVYFTRITYWTEGKINKVKKGVNKVLVGGAVLAIFIFVLPPIYGEGYDTIKLLLTEGNNQILQGTLFSIGHENLLFMLLFLVLIILVKPIASAVTISAGGCGGIFAPSLFVGGIVGFVYASIANIF